MWFFKITKWIEIRPVGYKMKHAGRINMAHVHCMDFSSNCRLTVEFINLRLHINGFLVYRMCHCKHNPSSSHVLWQKYKQKPFPPRNRLKFHQDSRVIVILVARLLLSSVTQKLCGWEHGVLTQKCMCSFWNTTWHLNRLFHFLQHLAAHTLTRKYRIK